MGINLRGDDTGRNSVVPNGLIRQLVLGGIY